MNNINNINGLPPFKRFCVTIGNLPSSYVDSMSYYECLMWLCKYLKDTVIPAVNENAEAVNELINWFNNLDVTEEINAKLDQMVEDGTIYSYVQPYFDNVVQPQLDTFESNIENIVEEQNSKINDQDSTISAINTLVQDVTSGSPLVASSTSEMTDTTKIYVNTTDGKWYYYDGDSWEIGGTYQSAEDSDTVSLLKETVDESIKTIGRTIVGEYTATTTGYVSKTDGTFHSYGTGEYKCSDYISLDNVNEIYANAIPNIDGGMAFYNASKVFISGVGSYSNISIPANAKYVRFTHYTLGSDYGSIILYKANQDVSITYKTLIMNKWINPDDGNVYSATNYSLSYLLPIGDSIVLNCTQNAGAGIVFYNANKQFISGTRNYTNLNIPENAKYMVVTNYSSEGNMGSITMTYNTLTTKTDNIKNCLQRSGYNFISTPNSSNNDLNTLQPNKLYLYSTPTSVSHVPFTETVPFSVLTYNDYSNKSTNGATQLVIRQSDGQLFTRCNINNTWGAWTTDTNSLPLRNSIDDSLEITSTTKCAFFGDSITYGVLGDRTIEEYTTENWVKLLMEKIGVTNYTNYSEGGATLSEQLETNIISQLQSADLSEFDVIFICAGTNDYGQNTSASTFIDGLSTIVSYLTANYTGKVVFITPIRRIVAIGADVNGRVLPLEWYSETIFEYALSNEYSVINGFDLGFPRNTGTYMTNVLADGLHPTYLGYRLYARNVYDILKNNIS